MGTGGALATSLSHAANFVFKLHRAFGDAVDAVSGVRLYPVMDGLYVTSESRNTLQSVIRNAFVELANEFLGYEEVPKHFIARGVVAYGATLHGANVPDEAFIPGIRTEFEAENRDAFAKSSLKVTRSALLLSSAMAVAYRADSKAPPFGIYVHDTALSIPQLIDPHDSGFPSRLWSWWRGNVAASGVAEELATALMQYFDEADQHSRDLDYPSEAIKSHRNAAQEYFGEFLSQSKKST
jgi:hypothetical protein